MIALTNPQPTGKAGHRMTELPLLFTRSDCATSN